METAPSLEERLEQNEILTFAPCPFALPDLADRDFLYRQQEGGLTHKNISLNPHNGALTGFVRHSAEQAAQLQKIMEHFAGSAESWLRQLLPGYAQGWHRDRVTFRCEEEATRRLRQNARNDLLHVDAFATRPTGGGRILRLFVNIHPTEPRVWMTSESFAELLRRFGDEVKRSANQWSWKLRQGLWKFFGQTAAQPTEYDAFMIRLHHFLIGHDEFQDRARKKFHHFGPGTAWLALTDGFCHAELRGRFALEHSFFVQEQHLALPNLAPVALWRKSSELTAHAA